MTTEYRQPGTYAQVYADKPTRPGARRKVILTDITKQAIDRRVRMVRSAGTNGFRIYLGDLADSLGLSYSAGRAALRRYLQQTGAWDIVYTSEDQMWTGDV